MPRPFLAKKLFLFRLEILRMIEIQHWAFCMPNECATNGLRIIQSKIFDRAVAYL